MNTSNTGRNPDLEDDTERAAQICVVYDPRTGRVVHTHEFFGTGFNREECARMALDTVERLGRDKTAGLEVLHPPELQWGPDMTLRVDLTSKQLVTKAVPWRRSRST
jgi:hypothetical protein